MKRSRGFVRFGVLLGALAVATAISGAASGGSAGSNGKGMDPALIQKLKENARGSVSISERKSTKVASFVRAGQNGDLLPGERGRSSEAKAEKFLGEYGALLGVENAQSELVQISSTTDAYGATHVSYEQVYNGVPVFGGTIRAHLDADGNLTAVNGVAVPDIQVDTTPRLSPSEAASRAIATVVADPPTSEATGAPVRLNASDLYAASSTLYVYRMGLIRGVEGASQLVYEIVVTNGSSVRDFVYVHAHAGKVVNRYSTVNDALFRRIFEGQGTPQNPLPPIQVWQEGDDPGILNVDQRNIHDFSGDSYRFFDNVFGRDSYDAAGAEMKIVNNDPTISCPNANWNGNTTNYCNGVTSDDVVAHEWGHAYTQFTHDLIYQWQPGALNESYSDIWGETIDQLNGVGSDAPVPVRTVGACSTHTVPVPVLVINTPTPGECPAGAAAFGPPLTPTGVTGDLVLGLDDTAAPGPSTTDGCSALTNAAAVAGKIALVDRGGCTFVVKVKNAQTAGAIGAVVANNAGTAAFGLGGADPTITIPSLGISLPHGNLLKGYLQAGGSNVTLKVKGSALPREDSFRWLMAEDSTAFNATAGPGNHAIRDMWDPTCLTDPGKVSDAEYHCDTSDAGGVHTNSGVPNHGYALLVDGGTYNGQTVTGIGLTKAAHIYWQAQSVYQTKTSDFDDHADALEQSCADLIGDTLTDLSTGAPKPAFAGTISAADCAEVTDMIAAVELRSDPTAQCNFTPLLNPNTPDLCADQKNPPALYKENFEGGLGGWTLTNEGRFAGWAPPTNWIHDTSLPGGRAGSAAFAEDRDGQCDGGAGDRSGVMHLLSPAIKLPPAAVLSPRLTFQHYLATEFGFDGGNVKISINGGAFAIVPATAFVFNAYNTTFVTAAAGNTNPLAGEPAFSGTDGGQVFGSWGESQIDLTKLGVKPGDTIQIRFDFGMDGCAAIDGWYVDDVEVRACNTKKGPRGRD